MVTKINTSSFKSEMRMAVFLHALELFGREGLVNLSLSQSQ